MCEAETNTGTITHVQVELWSCLILASQLELGKNPVVFGNVEMTYFHDENCEIWKSRGT